LDSPAIFTTGKDSEGKKTSTWQGTTTFAEALAGQSLKKETIELILSLFFFDVRFKTYIEIRAADSLPIHYALSCAALIKGLFSRKETVQLLAEYFEHLSAADIASAKTALREQGYEALVYQRPATQWLDEIFALSHKGLGESERPYLEPLAQLVAARTTLIDGARTQQA
jgi:glutamate--cysteine ligase